MDKAQEVNKAYAPYSRFGGRSPSSANGTVVLGNNQEKCGISSRTVRGTCCCISCGCQLPQWTILWPLPSLLGHNAKQTKFRFPPCQACRQALAEYEITKKDIALYFMGETGKVVKAHSIKSLFPFVIWFVRIFKFSNSTTFSVLFVNSGFIEVSNTYFCVSCSFRTNNHC